MKKIILILSLAFITGSIFFYSCNKNQDEQLEIGYSEVIIPNNFGITNSLKSNDGVFIPEEERIMEKDFILQLSDKEVIGTQIIELDEYGNMIKLELSNNVFSETELDENFLLEYSELNSQKIGNLKSVKNIGTCLKACGDSSIKHPGWCKAGCWAGLVITAAAVIVAAFAI